MRHINQYSHIPFLRTRLMSLLSKDSFSYRMRKTIGAEIDAILDSDDDEDRLETGGEFYETGNYSVFFPVESLFMWISKNGGITPEFLENGDGSFLDDKNELIPAKPIPSLTGVEQMAAYGLWLLDVEIDICGPTKDEDYDENRISPYGLKEIDVIHHKAECLLNAYQALSYAQRLLHNTMPTAEEIEKAAKFDFSALGKAGARKRHAPMRDLEKWAVDQYRLGKWSSANDAAHQLKDKTIAHGRTIGAFLKESNAQRTIAGWFSKDGF